jgi:hypothetical protein
MITCMPLDDNGLIHVVKCQLSQHASFEGATLPGCNILTQPQCP